MSKKSLVIIPEKDRIKYRCSLCGETKSVKYFTHIYDPVQSSDTILAPICNSCALKMILTKIRSDNND